MTDSKAHPSADGGLPLAAPTSAHGCAALAALCIAVSIFIAAVPVDLRIHYEGINVYEPSLIGNVNARIGVSSAYADATPVQGAMSLLEEYANASGLPSNDFIADVCGCITVSTGMITGVNDGISIGKSAAENLSNLVDAADYPDWDTLDSSTQANWGSKENYDAAKFVTFLDALGFEDLSRQYYDSFDGSGGGNLELSEELSRKLQQIGRIGSRWASGLSNGASEIKEIFGNRADYDFYFGPDQAGIGFNGVGVPTWPAKLPAQVQIGYGSYYQGDFGVYKVAAATSRPVYWMVCDSTVGWLYIATWSQDGPYSWAYNRNGYKEENYPTAEPARNANYYQYTEVSFYATDGNNAVPLNSVISTTFPINHTTMGINDGGQMTAAIRLILANGGPVYESAGPDLSGYPEDGPAEEDVFYPSDGISNNTTWNNFVYPSMPVVRPENPFNPGNQSASDNYKDDTEANVKGLQGIRFDKLFPFCLLWDVKLVFEKMQSLGVLPESGQSSGSGLETQGEVTDNWSVYTHISLPIGGFDPTHDFISDGEEITLDLTPLQNLLLIIRPVLQVLFIVTLLLSLVYFWKGVIFG